VQTFGVKAGHHLGRWGSFVARFPGRLVAAVATRGHAGSIDLMEELEPRILLSSLPEGFSPADIRQAYGIDAVTFGAVAGDGTGQTIAIISVYNDPKIKSDLIAFDRQFGISDPPKFTVIAQDGTSNLPGTDPAGPGDYSWEGETAMDVEWAHAIAPGAKILLVEANSAMDSDLFVAIDTARKYSGVSVISLSIAGDEFSYESSDDHHFATPSGHNGVTFVIADGDDGTGALYPASSPNVLSVGGTTLRLDAGGNYISEVAWGNGGKSNDLGGTGGGISKYEKQPAYQKGVVTQSATMRTLPDVAFDADPETGVPVYDSWDYGATSPWSQSGGTSLAAPAWAALIAIADQGRTLAGLGTLDGRTQTLPMLYALPSQAFHDITSGNNGNAAGPGYDLLTGLGTPVADRLIKGLIPPTAANDAESIDDSGNADLFDVLANDQDHNGVPMTITAVGGAAHGTVAIVNGQVQYQLTDLSAYADSFTYTISDDFGGTATATVNLAVRFDDPDVAIGNGHTAKSLAYTDSDGTVVTVSLSKGTADLQLAGSDLTITGTKNLIVIGSVQLTQVLFSGTSTATTMKIATKGGLDGMTTVGEITGATPVGKFIAPGVDLQGAGVTMTGQGFIGSLTMHDIDANIAMPGAGPSGGLKIAAHRIDTADITLASRLASLKASQWDSGWLIAPSAGTIAITGDRKLPLPGDLGADITLTMANAKGAAMGKLTVAGTLEGAVEADAGSVTSITAGAWTGGTLTAESVGKALVKGSLMGVSLTLTQPPSTTRHTVYALGRLAVTGRMVGSTVNSAGSIGVVSVGTMESSQLCAGLAAPMQSMPQVRSDFFASPDNTLPKIKSITVLGVVGQAYSFQNSIIAAWDIGAVRLEDIQFDTPGSAAWFGISANHLASYRRRLGKAVSYAWATSLPWPADDQQDFHVLHVPASV